MAIGAKRLVVGAHYGLRDWMVQRVTAVVLGLYVIGLVLYLLFQRDLGYEQWAGLFAATPMKIVTLLAIAALLYHAWIGLRDFWMDYIKPAGVRLLLLVASVLYLLFCAVWSVQILWSV
jgi:succinate dehydrogenase / fumarate reductase, membrane anchor subunit